MITLAFSLSFVKKAKRNKYLKTIKYNFESF